MNRQEYAGLLNTSAQAYDIGCVPIHEIHNASFHTDLYCQRSKQA